MRIVSGNRSTVRLKNSVPFIRGIRWTEIEVVSEKSGAPKMILHGGTGEFADSRGIKDILVTISHCRNYATATAIALVSR